MKNLGYLECQKGGYHTGEFINIICLNPACKDNLLCCCACVQEFHSSHKTQTLKKFLIDAQTLAKNHKQHSKPAQKIKNTLNTDIMANIVQNEQTNIITKLHQLKVNFVKEIDDLQNCIHTYFKSLYQELSKTSENSDHDPKIQVIQTIQLVQGSGNIDNLKNNVLKLLKGVDNLERIQNGGSSNFQAEEQSYLNFLKNSNIDIENIVQVRIKNLYTNLAKQVSKMKSINSKVSSFWSNKLYKFDPVMTHHNIQVLNPFTVKATGDSVYQMALMSPALSFKKQVETFTFRVNASDLEWVGLGVAYKKIAEKNKYQFNSNGNGHGCYMISGNAGTWSHSDAQFNNIVKAFSFKQGDSVTCTVTNNKILFFKNVPPELQQSLQYSQRQYYELEIKNQTNDTLHPCVVCFYENTVVEYLPSFKNLQINLPNYTFKFDKNTKHNNLTIYNDNHLVACEPTSYKSCILDRAIEGKELPNNKKTVTFRIVKSTESWIGVGVCHKDILWTKNYDFHYENVGHGCYMISANGGAWSNIDQNENNIVKTFKFADGDLITVTLDEETKKVHFRRGIDRYELKYTPIEGSPLYPVVILYYPTDEVDVMPDF